MNRVALVTGASRGIGRAIAAELAEEGHAVCINYLTHRQEAETLAEKIRNHGGNAIAVQADVADRAAVEAMVRTAEAELGPVSLLVNNAGIAGQIQFQDITDAQWNRYLGVNLGGARNTIQAVLPHMLHEKAGCIVNISSIWGLRGASCEVAYACTKAALVGLTRSLALELAPSHIRVNCVAPGVINTDMVSNGLKATHTKFENFVRCSKLNFPYCPSWLPVERQRIIDVSIWVFPTPFLPINTWMLVGGLESGTT